MWVIVNPGHNPARVTHRFLRRGDIGMRSKISLSRSEIVFLDMSGGGSPMGWNGVVLQRSESLSSIRRMRAALVRKFGI